MIVILIIALAIGMAIVFATGFIAGRLTERFAMKRQEGPEDETEELDQRGPESLPGV